MSYEAVVLEMGINPYELTEIECTQLIQEFSGNLSGRSERLTTKERFLMVSALSLMVAKREEDQLGEALGYLNEINLEIGELEANLNRGDKSQAILNAYVVVEITEILIDSLRENHAA